MTDPSLFIRSRITPQPQKRESSPLSLRAAFLPDRWADCSCFLRSNMTCYCHYLIFPLSHHLLTRRNGLIPLPFPSLRLSGIQTCPYFLVSLFTRSIFPLYSSCCWNRRGESNVDLKDFHLTIDTAIESLHFTFRFMQLCASSQRQTFYLFLHSFVRQLYLLFIFPRSRAFPSLAMKPRNSRFGDLGNWIFL